MHTELGDKNETLKAIEDRYCNEKDNANDSSGQSDEGVVGQDNHCDGEMDENIAYMNDQDKPQTSHSNKHDQIQKSCS